MANKSSKPIKDRYIGARVDNVFGGELDNYVANVEDMTMGDLVRRALREFLTNHPLKGAATVEPSIKALAGKE